MRGLSCFFGLKPDSASGQSVSPHLQIHIPLKNISGACGRGFDTKTLGRGGVLSGEGGGKVATEVEAGKLGTFTSTTSAAVSDGTRPSEASATEVTISRTGTEAFMRATERSSTATSPRACFGFTTTADNTDVVPS